MYENGLPRETSCSVETLRPWLVEWMAQELRIDPESIDSNETFLSYAMNSVQAMTMVGDIEAKLGLRLPPTLTWDYPNINALVSHLAERLSTAPIPTSPPLRSSNQISDAKVESLLAELDILSDQDVDQLLGQFLADSK